MKNTLYLFVRNVCTSGCVDDEEEFVTGGNTQSELTPENKETQY